MISIAQVVEDISVATPFVGEAISLDLLNFSGFARCYKKEIEKRTMKPVTVGAIVMALKRLSQKKLKKRALPSVFSLQPDIIVRSNLFEMTIAKSSDFFSKQKSLLNLTDGGADVLLTVTDGVFETTLIASQNVMEKVQTVYKEATIISTVNDLSAITIKFPKDIIDTPGIIYTMLNIVSWNGVSLVEVVSTYSEFTLIVKNKDVGRVFSLIQKLFSHNTR